jgi:hypothetical protein
MFEANSRYYSTETAEYTTDGGRSVTYIRRRFLPQGEDMQLLVEITVAEGERLDLISARTIGDPEQFWRICDANNAMNPVDLTSESGKVLRVPIPQV